MHRPIKSAESLKQAVRDAVIADPSVAGLLHKIPHLTLVELPFGPRNNEANWDLAVGACATPMATAVQAAKLRIQEESDVAMRPPGFSLLD